MKTHQLIRIVSLAVVFAGGAYLSATPAQAAEAFVPPCNNAGWSLLVRDASTVCGGQASIVAECVGGSLVLREVYCY